MKKPDTLFLNDRAELSFVEVLMIEYQPGDKEYQRWFDKHIDLFDEPWEMITEKIEKTRPFFEPDLLITSPLTVFRFQTFGQSKNREYSSAIDFQIYQTGASDVFEGWQDNLKEISKGIPFSEDKYSQGKTKRFVTLWSFMSWEDTYNHEWDAEWNLLGIVDPYKIKDLVVGNDQS